MNEALLEKTDARTRRVLSQGEPGSYEALIRTASLITAEERARLEMAGFITFCVVGTVLSGAIPSSGCLDAVAELPFVEEIELSRPLYEE